MSDERPPLTWHLLADDGVMMTQRDPETGASQSHRVGTTRPVGPDDLHTYDERLAAQLTRWATQWRPWMALVLVLVLASAAGALVGLVIAQLGATEDVAAWLLWGLLPISVVGTLVVVVARWRLNVLLRRIHTDAGLELSQLQELDEHEARALLEAPGTVAVPARSSGPRA